MSILNSGVTQQLSKDSKARILLDAISSYIVLVVVLLRQYLCSYFLTISNLLSVLLQTASLAILAIGQAAVLILGGIDLSMPGVMALGSIFGAMYMRTGGNPVLRPLIMLLVPAALEFDQWYFCQLFRHDPFVVTLACKPSPSVQQQ